MRAGRQIKCWNAGHNVQERRAVERIHLLQPVAAAWSLHMTTDLLARIGGDEFIVLLPETGIEGAHTVTAKLRKALAAYGQQFSPAVPALSFCAGVCQLRQEDTTIDDILSRADVEQYLAKGTGPGHARSVKELVVPPPPPPAK